MTPPSDTETSDGLRRIGEQLATMFSILFTDVAETAQLVVENRSDSNRRHFVRAAMAYIEGATYQMKQLILSLAWLPAVELSDGDLAMLREVRYSLDPQGNVQVKEDFPRMEANIRFTLNVIAKAFDDGYRVDPNDDGWKALQESIKLRNRLSHPKTPSDLEVGESEANRAALAVEWFARTAKALRLITSERVAIEKAVMQAFLQACSITSYPLPLGCG